MSSPTSSPGATSTAAPLNAAAVAFASSPSEVMSALSPSSSPLKVGTTADADHGELALAAAGLPRR